MANTIKLINRELQVPHSQKIIGVQYDNCMEYRDFVVPKIINGIDVSGYAFALQISPIDTTQDTYYDLLQKVYDSEDEDNITLRWIIQAHNTINSGRLNVSLKIFDGENTYQSFITTFTISDDIPAYHQGQLLPPNVFEQAVAECFKQANLAEGYANSASNSETNINVVKANIDTIYTDIQTIHTDIIEKQTDVSDNTAICSTEADRAKLEADRAEAQADKAELIATNINSELESKLEVSNIIQGSNITLVKDGNNVTINSTGTGEGGTSDYTLLTNKPTINSVELTGNKTSSELGLSAYNHTHTDLHTHTNKSVLDTITNTLISAWNSAVTHISDAIKHITSDERTLWNTITNKVDKVAGKSLMDDTEITRLASVSNYDDTSLVNRVDTLEDTSLSVDNFIQGENITLIKEGNDITISASGTVSATDTVARNSIADLEVVVDGKANIVHTHTISDVTNLQTVLDGKQPIGSYLTSVPSEYVTDTELTSTLSSYALNSNIPDVSTKLEASNIIAGTNVTIDVNGNNVTVNASGGTSTGDMLKSVYDTGNIQADVYNRANHTGTQLASTISDFQTQVSANTDLLNKVDKVTGKSLVLDTDIIKLTNLSGTNTGDETNDTIKTKLGNVSETTDGYLTSTQYNSLLSASGTGDMLKSIYDTNNNGIVDNAEKVNNHTVEIDVPSNAVFTDTVYIHPTIHSPSIIAQDTANRFVTDIEKTTWNNKASSDVATTSINGLMSSTDKTKLNGIADNANNYSLPTASTTTLGGVKVDGTTININNGVISSIGGSSSGGGVKVVDFTIGTSTNGWTSDDCDYLCDGVADDVEFNNAITALPTTGGKIVVLSGTYNITSKINVNKNNVVLEGNGKSTVLKRMYNSSSSEGIIILSTVSNCKISDFYIDGNKSIYTYSGNYGIRLTSSNKNIIENITCCNNYYYGIYLSSSTMNTIVKNICIDNNNDGINLLSSTENIIKENICNNNNNGIYLQMSNNNIIINNTCSSNSYGCYISSSNTNTIVCNSYNNNINDGIRLSSANANSITINTCNDNSVAGIKLASSDRNLISSNICIRGTGVSSDYTSSQYTIFLFSTANDNNLISSNMCLGKAVVIDGGTANTEVNNKF